MAAVNMATKDSVSQLFTWQPKIQCLRCPHGSQIFSVSVIHMAAKDSVFQLSKLTGSQTGKCQFNVKDTNLLHTDNQISVKLSSLTKRSHSSFWYIHSRIIGQPYQIFCPNPTSVTHRKRLKQTPQYLHHNSHQYLISAQRCVKWYWSLLLSQIVLNVPFVDTNRIGAYISGWAQIYLIWAEWAGDAGW